MILFCFVSYSLQSHIVNKEPLSARTTGYKIDASLNVVTKTVSGTMETFWVNQSEDIVPDAQMHLYLNAFKSSKTTFYQESPIIDSNSKIKFDGWIEIKSITDRYGDDLAPQMQFIRPDDGNADDNTVLKINLPQAAKPGDTVFFKINFESKLPSNIIRTGYNDDFYFVAQWFPKFGVYEPAGMRYATKGGWNCHQFHANSEFYSDHSVYDVKITLPKEYVVGSGGLLTKETEDGDHKTLTYRAEDIVDFAWTAWPGYVVYTDQWKHVTITLLLPKERSDQVNRQFIAVKNALEYLAENVGPYPWPHLTFVDPPSKGSGAGGMEYTTLFTSQSFNNVPGFLHFPEMVTIHEFGHAYFMGILASNEFEEPWLDEGINSFWESRIIDYYYGKNSGMIDHPWLKIADAAIARTSYIMSDKKQLVSNSEYSWNYPQGTYGMMSYMKPAVTLSTLMGLTGEETMNEIFREYYRKWAFRNPSGKDFINVVNEVVTRTHGNKFGADMNWFFDQTIYGTGICDYKVGSIRNDQVEDSGGMIESGDSLNTGVSGSESIYRSVVSIERSGEVKLPVDVLVHFEDGKDKLESWDGKDRFMELKYSGRKVQWVKVDPEFRIKLDINYINNSMTTDPDRVPVRRLIDKYISFMQFFINLISL